MTMKRKMTGFRQAQGLLAAWVLCAALSNFVVPRSVWAMQPQDANSRRDGPAAESKPVRERNSPRAMMRTFLIAVQEASGEHPERIEDAVACLNTSELAGEDVADQARRLAQRLHAIIQAYGVTLDDIPETLKADRYQFLSEKSAESEGESVEIGLVRDPDTSTWQFSPATLAAIPALEASLQQRAKESPPVKKLSNVPASRRSARATMQTFLASMNAEPPNLTEAVYCLDPTGRDVVAWSIKGVEFATTLKTIMDRNKIVVLAEIPDVPDGPDYVWYAGESGQIALARIEETPVGKWPKRVAPKPGEWRFTRQTIDGLDALFRAFEDKQLIRELQEAGVKERLTLKQTLERRLPPWARKEIWKTAVWQWVALAALVPLGWIVFRLSAAIANVVLGAWLRRRKIPLEGEAQNRVARSSGAFVMVLVWYYAIRLLGLPEELIGPLARGIKFLMGVTAIWVVYRYVDVLGSQIASNEDVQLTRFDDVLIPMLRKILRMFVVVVGIVLIAEWMGKEWKTALGALGIGGVALAFAAQDTISNFFGSITVLFDRPFGIGDWIKVGDVEGTVERVGFRSTRVRTFYNSIITVPNAKMANTQVDNYGARQFRRVRIMLSLPYDTPPEKIEAFCEGVRELIRLQPFTRKDYYHVYLNQMAASSLDVLLYLFFETPDWSTELRERHRLFLDILDLAKRLGVEFAFPTQTVWLAQSPDDSAKAKPAPLPADVDAESYGVQEAAKLYKDRYGTSAQQRGPVVIDKKPRSQQ